MKKLRKLPWVNQYKSYRFLNLPCGLNQSNKDFNLKIEINKFLKVISTLNIEDFEFTGGYDWRDEDIFSIFPIFSRILPKVTGKITMWGMNTASSRPQIMK
mmetsp:Transcript_26069/g.23065  ORF Transcript_26069/g.23065 Transcript_26069/m.23065 type:complete len:101 (+) Transcript_26069:167-469(+)